MSNTEINADNASKVENPLPNTNSVSNTESIADNASKAENPMPSPQQEEAAIKKKYGGLLPKKNPLISKDHERAFFDSADWALGKQGTQKSKGPLEALRPKLQPTPQQQARSRRSAYARADEGEDGDNACGIASEDQSCTLDGSSNDHKQVDGDKACGISSEDQGCTLDEGSNDDMQSKDRTSNN